MSHKYDGNFMHSLSDAVERVFGRWLRSQRRVLGHPGALATPPDRTYDYAAEFDQSRHAQSIEYSRERSVGCWDTDETDE